jgi:hypothetical protein
MMAEGKLDPTTSPLIERTGAFVAVTVVCLMGWCLVLPYITAYFNIQVSDADHAAQNQIQTTISNVFVAVVSFFFGASAGTRKKDETIQTLATTADKAQNALPAVIGAVPGAAPVGVAADGGVVLKAGQHVDVAAAPMKPDDMSQADWDALSADDKKARSKK